MIRISVIVPVYNMEKYIEKCVNSIINQTLKEIEIIFIDDGSTDNSYNILHEYSKKDRRIQLLKQENSGQGIARNKGIKVAKGEYISFIDSDDFIDLNMLEKLYNMAIKNNSEIAVCLQKYVDENDNDLLYDTKLQGEFGNVKSNPSILSINMGPCNKIFKTKFLDKHKIQFSSNRLMWYEDLPFVASSILKARNISWVNEHLYNYVQRNNSTTNNKNIQKNLDIIKSFEVLQKNMHNDYKEELEYLCIEHVLIATSLRILKMKEELKNKKVYLKDLNKYISIEYPNYSENKYLSNYSKKKKLILYLLRKRQYFLIFIIFKLKEKIIKVIKNEGF